MEDQRLRFNDRGEDSDFLPFFFFFSPDFSYFILILNLKKKKKEKKSKTASFQAYLMATLTKL